MTPLAAAALVATAGLATGADITLSLIGFRIGFREANPLMRVLGRVGMCAFGWAATIGTMARAGATTVRMSGAAAPSEKVSAEVSAACTGREAVISEMPSSSRACVPSASFAVICMATVRARPASSPRRT